MTHILDSAYLKQAWNTMAFVFKGNDQYRALGLIVKESTLYLQSTTVECYLIQIPLKTKADKQYSISVVFTDISDLLPNEGVVELEINEASVTIRTDIAETNLIKANYGAITLMEIPSNETEFYTDALFNGLQTLTSPAVTYLAKIYKVDPAIELFSKVAIMRFPTVYLKVASSGIEGSISIRTANLLRKLKPNKYSEDENALYLMNNISILRIAKSKVKNGDNFSELLKGTTHITKIAIAGFTSRINALVKIAGNGTVVLSFLENGVTINASRSGLSLNTTVGVGERKVSTQMPIEIFNYVVSILGDTFDISYRKGILWFHTGTLDILTSVEN